MIAYVSEATMSDGRPFPFAPLLNVVTEDGQRFNDLTPAQLFQLREREGWEVEVEGADSVVQG